MKKTLSIVLALVLALAALTGCGSAASTPAATEAPAAADTAADTASDAAEAPAELEVIKVGATATPHGEILESIKDALAAEGYELDIVIYDDYVLPNKALADGELDANYFQHRPYLNSYNEQNGTDLVSAAVIHYEPFGIYSNGVASLADLAEGATILIPVLILLHISTVYSQKHMLMAARRRLQRNTEYRIHFLSRSLASSSSLKATVMWIISSHRAR